MTSLNPQRCAKCGALYEQRVSKLTGRTRRMCQCIIALEPCYPSSTPAPIAQHMDDGLTLKQRNCTHGMTFDADTWRAADMTVTEVRDRWPRFFGECKKCGFSGIAYVSYEHYVAGDW